MKLIKTLTAILYTNKAQIYLPTEICDIICINYQELTRTIKD